MQGLESGSASGIQKRKDPAVHGKRDFKKDISGFKMQREEIIVCVQQSCDLEDLRSFVKSRKIPWKKGPLWSFSVRRWGG